MIDALQKANIRLDAAKRNLELRRTKLREAAAGYVHEAALYGQTNSDGMAELEAQASEFHAAYVELRNAEGDQEMAELMAGRS